MRLIDANRYKSEAKSTQLLLRPVIQDLDGTVYASTAITLLDNQPTIRSVDALKFTKMQWHPYPVSKPIQPEFGEDGYIIQTSSVKSPYSAYWDGEDWTDVDDRVIDNVIAWMPLPDTYEGFYQRATNE